MSLGPIFKDIFTLFIHGYPLWEFDFLLAMTTTYTRRRVPVKRSIRDTEACVVAWQRDALSSGRRDVTRHSLGPIWVSEEHWWGRKATNIKSTSPMWSDVMLNVNCNFWIIKIFLNQVHLKTASAILLRSHWLHIEGILPKGPYLPCVSMPDRALLAGYHRYVYSCTITIFIFFFLTWPIVLLTKLPPNPRAGASVIMGGVKYE